jgi:hypothetical protein
MRDEFGIGRSQTEASRIREWLEREIAKQQNMRGVDFSSLSHGLVRYLKSVGLLYVGFIKQRRNILSANPNITSNLLSAIDRQITAYEEEMNEQGVFGKATPISLLVAQDLLHQPVHVGDQSLEKSIANETRPKPVLVKTIEILDQELRNRCLDLFNQFEQSGQPERHDTVIAEATRILENRLRNVIGATQGEDALALVTKAFGGKKPIIQVSDVHAEQEAVHLLFRGVFGFIRNPVHHKLIPDLAPSRVVQVLGLLDYLIYIIAKAGPLDAVDE